MKKKTYSMGAAIAERRVVGVEDLVLLTKITNEGIVANLKMRFDKDEIYTCVLVFSVCLYATRALTTHMQLHWPSARGVQPVQVDSHLRLGAH